MYQGLRPESLRAIPNDVEVAYSCPPKPDGKDYTVEIDDMERRVVRAKQHHKCEFCRCLIVDRNGVLRCK